jgi:hypothetical protein
MLLHILADYGDSITLQVLRELGNADAQVELLGDTCDLHEAVDFASTLLAIGRADEAAEVLDAAARAAMEAPALVAVA